jgi:hypothetical protein
LINPLNINQKRLSAFSVCPFKVDVKEMLKEHNQQLLIMYKKIDENIELQRSNLLKKLNTYKQIKLLNIGQKSFSVSRKHLLLNSSSKRKVKIRSSDILPNIQKKRIFERIMVHRKIGFKMIPISQVFDNYFKKFHHIFNEEVFNHCFLGAYEIVSRSFKELIENYNKAEDSVEDFRLTFQENDLSKKYC